MFTSIVLPTFNRLDRLTRVLAAFERQTISLAEFEIVVVSDGSTDGTNDFLRTLQTPLRITPIFQANQGVAVARNTGITRAFGDLILFVDDDVVPSPNLIEQHIQTHLQNGDRVVVLGPMLTPHDFVMAAWVYWEQAMLQKQYDAMTRGDWSPTARQFYTGNTSLRRQHIIDAGGFDARFRRAEDVELAYRLADRGLKFVFNPNAIGWHYAERSFASWIQIPYVYGRNDVIFTREKKQTWLVPTIMHEFRQRHVFIRALTHICLDHARASALVIELLKLAARAGTRLGMGGIPRAAYSAIFNLRHYQGIADELGGRAKFFQGVGAAQHSVRVPGMEA